MRKLSILIPVYNEKYYIEQVVEDVLRVPLPDGVERELVIVDDASNDGTADILARIESQYEEVRVFYQDHNMGKGSAIRLAIAKATGDVSVVQDADLEYDPAELPRLLEPILAGDADAVYGSRFISSRSRRILYFWHSLGNRLLTGVSNCLTNLNLTDMETCYKMVKTDILQSIPIRCNRFGIEPELTAKLAKRGCRIYEVPISYRGRTYGEGKKITWRDGVKAFAVMFYFRFVDDLYNEQYGKAILHSMSSAHRFNKWMADRISPWVGDRVLEIGAGMGNMTQKFLPRWAYHATDVEAVYIDYLENRYASNQRVTVGKLNLAHSSEFVAHEEEYDTVICLNVLEHVEDDDLALQSIYSSLQPGGKACVLVPRCQALFGSLDEALGHCRRYSQSELAEKLEAAGFELETIFTFNKASLPAWWINGKLLKRKHFGKIQLKLFDSLIWFWRILDYVLPWKGMSLIAVGKKP